MFQKISLSGYIRKFKNSDEMMLTFIEPLTESPRQAVCNNYKRDRRLFSSMEDVSGVLPKRNSAVPKRLTPMLNCLFLSTVNASIFLYKL